MASDEEPASKDEDAKKARLRTEFDSLHAEMEIADYAINHFGRSKRKVSREQSKVRTIKRKHLEVEDAKESAIQTTNNKRIRGSRAALEDDVIQGSLIFGANQAAEGEDDEDKGNDSDYVEMDAEGEMGNYGEDNISDEEGRYELYADELNIDIEDDGAESDDEDASPKKSSDPSSSSALANAVQSRVKASSNKYSGLKIAKTMYRLKNFKSHKMAQRHGEALGAHARGLNVSAVDKLRDVAIAAPVAPQVYSSLGLVYESMLREETAKSKRNMNTGKSSGKHTESEDFEACQLDGEHAPGENADNVKERIKLAKKAFGSYHVAALLCKMDYSLWVSFV